MAQRFARYALRGPIANGRLQRGPRDLLTYQLKSPKPDGTTAVVLSPMALLQRLARLIPLPGRHMVRYHGVLSSAAESPKRGGCALAFPRGAEPAREARPAPAPQRCQAD